MTTGWPCACPRTLTLRCRQPGAEGPSAAVSLSQRCRVPGRTGVRGMGGEVGDGLDHWGRAQDRSRSPLLGLQEGHSQPNICLLRPDSTTIPVRPLTRDCTVVRPTRTHQADTGEYDAFCARARANARADQAQLPKLDKMLEKKRDLVLVGVQSGQVVARVGGQGSGLH